MEKGKKLLLHRKVLTPVQRVILPKLCFGPPPRFYILTICEVTITSFVSCIFRNRNPSIVSYLVALGGETAFKLSVMLHRDSFQYVISTKEQVPTCDLSSSALKNDTTGSHF